MDSMFLGLLLASVPLIYIVILGLIRRKNRQKGKKTLQKSEPNAIRSDSDVNEEQISGKSSKDRLEIQHTTGTIITIGQQNITVGNQEVIVDGVPISAYELAQRVTTVLVFHLLRKFNENIGGEAGKKLWYAINKNFNDRAAAAVIGKLTSNLNNLGRQLAFRLELEKALKQDPQFTNEIAELFQLAQASIDRTREAHDAGGSGASIQIGGDIAGNIVTGKQGYDYADRLAGDETTDAPPPEKKKKGKGK